MSTLFYLEKGCASIENAEKFSKKCGFYGLRPLGSRCWLEGGPFLRGLSQIAYIGGGFGAGIHNTLEAAVYGMPVLFGPRYHKFKEAKDLIAVGGGFSITDDSSFRTKMDELLTDPTALETSGQAAGDFVKNSVGATDQILRQIHIR